MKTGKSYILCFIARSGSNLLCELLRATKVAGRPHQYFWVDREQKWADKYGLSLADYRAFVTGIMEKSAFKNGVFGMKASYFILDAFVERARPMFNPQGGSKAEVLERIFPNLSYLWITRADKVRQAISFARAEQSQVWTSKQSPGGVADNLKFDYDHIARSRTRLVDQEKLNEDFFTQNGIVPFRITYEELVKAPEESTKRVLDFLKIKDPIAKDAFAARKLEKQGDALNDEWYSRFLEEEAQRATGSAG